MPKALYRLLVIILGVLLVFYWIFPPVVPLLSLYYGGAKKLSPTLWLGGSGTTIKQDSLIIFTHLADQRLSDFWGGLVASPTVVLCADTDQYARLCQGGEGAGCTLQMPFGTWIIVNPDGLSVDVIAHELSHAELAARLGWWQMKRQVPTWFDEGLAVQFDHRFSDAPDAPSRYEELRASLAILTRGNQYMIPLEELETHRQFFGQDESYISAAYFTAGTAVSYYLATRPAGMFQRQVMAISNGDEKFGTVFPPVPITSLSN